MRKSEVLENARRYPELIKERALRLEDNAQGNLVTVKGLGRTFSWRGLLEQQREDAGAIEMPHEDCTCGR